MDSIFDFIYNTKKYYTLIGVDIIEGLDDNFYIVDVNGLIGLRRITQHLEEFNKNLNDIFNEDVYFDCSATIDNWDKIQIGSGKKESNIWLQNTGFSHENKLSWRNKFNLPSPKIEDEIVIHDNPDYPKYLLKPEFNFKSKGIELYNDSIKKSPQNGYFLEEFIPSKTIDNHCYNIRVIMAIDENNHHPLLYTVRKCANPIIRNIISSRLSEEESLSYISNRSNQSVEYQIYDNKELKKFVSNLKITT